MGYVLIFFLKGVLPWQNLKTKEKDKTKKVGELKAQISLEELCKDIPEEFQRYLDYVKKLNFLENPDYNYLKSMMIKMASNYNFLMDSVWDWNKSASLPCKSFLLNKKRNFHFILNFNDFLIITYFLIKIYFIIEIL